MHNVHNSCINNMELFPFVTFSCSDNNSCSTYAIEMKLHINLLRRSVVEKYTVFSFHTVFLDVGIFSTYTSVIGSGWFCQDSWQT